MRRLGRRCELWDKIQVALYRLAESFSSKRAKRYQIRAVELAIKESKP